MKRRNLTPKDNALNIEFNVSVGVKHSILRESSVVDEFYFEKTKCPNDSLQSVSAVDPIIMLFNQQRIDDMGSMAAKQFIDSFAQKSNSLQELRKQCSDDDLMSMIKSRHLQSPAEILAWCRYMNDNVEQFNAEVKKIAEEQAKETQNVEQQSIE